MSFLVADAVSEARRLVSDVAAERISDATFLSLFNRGREVAAVLRPDLFVVETEITLVEGAVQRYPAGTIRALPRMRVKGGNALTPFEPATMDAFRPGWQQDKAGTPEQWAPADDGPGEFYVWRPATAGIVVVAPLTLPPTPCTDLTDEVTTPGDAYQAALAHYMVFAVEAADDEHVLSQRALLAWQQFLNELGAAPNTPPGA